MAASVSVVSITVTRNCVLNILAEDANTLRKTLLSKGFAENLVDDGTGVSVDVEVDNSIRDPLPSYLPKADYVLVGGDLSQNFELEGATVLQKEAEDTLTKLLIAERQLPLPWGQV